MRHGFAEGSIDLDHIASILLAVGFLSVIVITIVHDNYVKERRKKEEQQLLLALAHDIRTPLTVIRGYTEGILDGVADTEEKRQAYLREVRSKTIEMERLLSDLMLYAQASADCMTYHFAPYDVSLETALFVDEMREGLSLRGAELCCHDMSGGGALVMADRELMQRVFTNIIENSVKYKRGSSCHIDITITSDDRDVCVSVADDGKGIRAEDIDRIFDNMYRGSEADSGISGSGIGLWLVRHIIEGHGGRVWAESLYGEGTTIFIKLKRYERW